MKKNSFRLLRDRSGVAAIEFALILPVLALFLLGIIEFGLYFTKYLVTNRVAGTTAIALQQNPQNAGDIEAIALAGGGGLINYNNGTNFICADSFATVAEAQSNSCTQGVWDVSESKAGVTTGTGYYVAVRFHVKQTAISALTNFLPDIDQTQVIPVGGAAGSSTKPPECDSQGKVLQTDASGNFKCVDWLTAAPKGTLSGYCNVGWNGSVVSYTAISPSGLTSNNSCTCQSGWSYVQVSTTGSGHSYDEIGSCSKN